MINFKTFQLEDNNKLKTKDDSDTAEIRVCSEVE